MALTVLGEMHYADARFRAAALRVLKRLKEERGLKTVCPENSGNWL
jgi:hypothetical protein